MPHLTAPFVSSIAPQPATNSIAQLTERSNTPTPRKSNRNASTRHFSEFPDSDSDFEDSDQGAPASVRASMTPAKRKRAAVWSLEVVKNLFVTSLLILCHRKIYTCATQCRKSLRHCKTSDALMKQNKIQHLCFKAWIGRRLLSGCVENLLLRHAPGMKVTSDGASAAMPSMSITVQFHLIHVCVVHSSHRFSIRWRNHLDPQLHHHPWTDDETSRLLDLIKTYGTTWTRLVSHFPGRYTLLTLAPLTLMRWTCWWYT